MRRLIYEICHHDPHHGDKGERKWVKGEKVDERKERGRDIEQSHHGTLLTFPRRNAGQNKKNLYFKKKTKEISFQSKKNHSPNVSSIFLNLNTLLYDRCFCDSVYFSDWRHFFLVEANFLLIYKSIQHSKMYVIFGDFESKQYQIRFVLLPVIF